MEAAIASKKHIRSNRDQIAYLCTYMTAHPEFAAGEYRSPLGARQHTEEWLSLKKALDELGPQRTVDQWKICWRDQKRKAREEGAAHGRARIATGNSVAIPPLSDTSAAVLSAIGPEMAIGMGPEESPIGPSMAVPVTEEVLATPMASSSSQRRIPIRRTRRALPADRFLNVQREMNGLLRELTNAVHRSNELKEAHLSAVHRSNQLMEEHLHVLRSSSSNKSPERPTSSSGQQ